MDRVDFENKEVFFKKIMNYWLLKRYSRNGVPILRRLQSIGLKKTNELKKLDQNENIEDRLKAEELNEDEKAKIYEELKEQHGYWKRLRQDLERARILMELIRLFYSIIYSTGGTPFGLKYVLTNVQYFREMKYNY